MAAAKAHFDTPKALHLKHITASTVRTAIIQRYHSKRPLGRYEIHGRRGKRLLPSAEE